MEQLDTVASIITALGGTASVASLFEVSTSAVSNWRVANKLPAHTYAEIINRLHAKGLAADIHLWAFTIVARSA